MFAFSFSSNHPLHAESNPMKEGFSWWPFSSSKPANTLQEPTPAPAPAPAQHDVDSACETDADDEKVKRFTKSLGFGSFTCSDLAARSMCSVYLCPTCLAAGYCDTSCNFCGKTSAPSSPQESTPPFHTAPSSSGSVIDKSLPLQLLSVLNI